VAYRKAGKTSSGKPCSDMNLRAMQEAMGKLSNFRAVLIACPVGVTEEGEYDYNANVILNYKPVSK
jgi:hypothetical protein